MGEYEKYLIMKDNFTIAAIRATDKKMRNMWKKHAKRAEKELKKISKKSIQEV